MSTVVKNEDAFKETEEVVFEVTADDRSWG